MGKAKNKEREGNRGITNRREGEVRNKERKERKKRGRKGKVGKGNRCIF